MSSVLPTDHLTLCFTDSGLLAKELGVASASYLVKHELCELQIIWILELGISFGKSALSIAVALIVTSKDLRLLLSRSVACPYR